MDVLFDNVGAGIDEGRAMAQLVHDLAPGAELAVADYANSEEGFADRIRALRAAGANVIVDDITYGSEPTRPLSEAIVFSTFPEVGTLEEGAAFRRVASEGRISDGPPPTSAAPRTSARTPRPRRGVASANANT